MLGNDGERLARLEQIALDVRGDIERLHSEEQRTRGRLHDLEKVTAGLVELQKVMHRENDLRLRRMGLSIQWGSAALAAGMLALALASFFAHH